MQHFLQKIVSLLWTKATRSLGPHFGLGMVSLFVSLVYWMFGFPGPGKPPKAPISEMRPHPNQETDQTEIAQLLDRWQSDLRPICLEMREKTELSIEISKEIQRITRRIHDCEEFARGRDVDGQDREEKKSGVSDSVRAKNRRKRTKRGNDLDACADSLREDLHSLELTRALINQRLALITKKRDALMEKCRKYSDIQNKLEQPRGFKLMSYRAIQLETGQSSGSNEPLPAAEDSGQDQDSRALLK